MDAATNVLTIPYPQDLLLSLKADERGFEAEPKTLLAVKLREIWAFVDDHRATTKT